MREEMEKTWIGFPWYMKILAGLGLVGAVYYFWHLKGTLIGFLLGASYLGVLLVSFGLISRGTYEAWRLAREKADEMAAAKVTS